MKYTLMGPNRFGKMPFEISIADITKVHHGTFGVFNNFQNIIAVKYWTKNSWGDPVEALAVLGYFERGKNIYGHLGFDFFLGKDPDHIQIYNFNSEYKEEDVRRILSYGATLKREN